MVVIKIYKLIFEEGQMLVQIMGSCLRFYTAFAL